MGQKTIMGSPELANSIKLRRNELGLTIEEAARKAGVGTKTWCRYEAGGAVRRDKGKGICRALNWHSFPQKESEEESPLAAEDYEAHEAWSSYIMENFGRMSAVSFVVGSDILLDNLQEDMEALASLPRGSHIGQVDISFLKGVLPPQFLMMYDYDFLYALYTTVIQLRTVAHAGREIVAHRVIDELALYLIVEESRFLVESKMVDDEQQDAGWDEWIFDIFDDMYIITFLYSNMYVSEKDTYHFSRWMEEQFYMQK